MTKAQILAELQATYKEVVPPQGNPELIETVGDVKKYLFHHLAVGIDDRGAAVAEKAFKPFFVWKEGDAAEQAYYERTAPLNSVDANTIAADPDAPTATEIYRIYASPKIRQRVKGMIIRAVNDIYWEDAGTPNHSARLKWAFNSVLNLEASTNIAIAFMAVDTAVLDGSYTDTTLRNIINGSVDKWAIAFYA